MFLSTMMKQLLLLCLALDLAHSAIVFGFGGCPSVVAKPDFVKSQYVGKWYEYARFNNWFERGLVCVTATYGENNDGSISVLNEGIKENSGEKSTANGKATVPNSNKPGELKVSFSSFDFTRGANYLILDTDYFSATLIFSCTNVPLLPVTFQTAWILIRSSTGLPPANLDALRNILDNYGIDSDKLKVTDQINCR